MKNVLQNVQLDDGWGHTQLCLIPLPQSKPPDKKHNKFENCVCCQTTRVQQNVFVLQSSKIENQANKQIKLRCSPSKEPTKKKVSLSDRSR